MILYRLPFEKNATKLNIANVLQLNDICEIDGHSGFIMVPFVQNSAPTLLFEVESEESFDIENCECNTAIDDKSVQSNQPSEEYTKAFNAFISALNKGEFGKLVLSRCQIHNLAFSKEQLVETFKYACQLYPRMMIYLAFLPDGDAWMGCTPEILIAGNANHYRTMALAGTMWISKGTPIKDISWSAKNRKEQEVVADYVRETIKPFASVIEEEGPYTSRAGELVHLKTEFHFTPNAKFSVGRVAKSLHPTPAVCGIPTKEAMNFILENENYDRSYYSGVVGLIGINGNTDLFVNLRCAHFTNKNFCTYAGGGLLPSSTLQSEWDETANKMNTILLCTKRQS